MRSVVTSSSATARRTAAALFLAERDPAAEVLLVGASRGAADDCVQSVAQRVEATFGITRFSLTELAARAAAVAMAGAGRAPSTQAAGEAVAARVAFDAVAAGQLRYFLPVVGMPGFSRALARTVHELRLAVVPADRLAAHEGSSSEVGCLLERVEADLNRFGLDDRAALFRLAASEWAAGRVRWRGLPLILLDVPLDARAERDLVEALVAGATDTIATVPADDRRTLHSWATIGAVIDVVPDDAPHASDLAHLRRYIFATERPPLRSRAGDVALFSAPGEGREAVEIVRRVLDEARRGVPFDEMAVFVRTPQQYLGLLEHACSRGGVPVFFERGTRRPDPAGRAFVALVSCAVEGLSAKRFDEYLSLGQVPRLGSPHRP